MEDDLVPRIFDGTHRLGLLAQVPGLKRDLAERGGGSEPSRERFERGRIHSRRGGGIDGSERLVVLHLPKELEVRKHLSDGSTVSSSIMGAVPTCTGYPQS